VKTGFGQFAFVSILIVSLCHWVPGHNTPLEAVKMTNLDHDSAAAASIALAAEQKRSDNDVSG